MRGIKDFCVKHLFSKIRSCLHRRSASHADILRHDRLAALARHLDRHRVGAEAGRVLEEVVLGPRRVLPRAAAVGRHLQRLDRLVDVLGLQAEPVLAGALLVLERDGRADATADDLPRHVDDALALGAQLREGVLEEVEVVRAAPWALVDHHDLDAVAVRAGHFKARAAVACIVPVRVGERGAVDSGGESVAGEGAHAAVEVAAVEGGFAGVGALGDWAGERGWGEEEGSEGAGAGEVEEHGCEVVAVIGGKDCVRTSTE